MLKFGNKEFRNIQEQVEKNAKDIEKLIEEGVPGGGSGDSGLPTDKPTDNGQILIGYTDGSVEWSTETIREFQHELVSGSNIKTINGESILGSGNIEISEGGTVSVDNVVEFDDNALIGASSNQPFVVDSTTMNKLKDPNTIIKYNNKVYYYSHSLDSIQYIVYQTPVYMSSNKVEGSVAISHDIINVRITSTGEYSPAGLWTTVYEAGKIPQELGTEYTDNGDYIWVANKNGSTRTGAWEKYTPGTGGGGTSGDLSDYYTKSQTDDQFVTKTVFNTTTMGINSVLDEIPTTYATNAGLAGLEVNVMRELSSLDGRVDALEAGGGSGTGGNFTPQGSITDDGQFLVGNTDGTYEWSTQTLPEIYNATEEAKTTANEAKTITVGFSENLSNLRLSLDATDEDVADLDTRVTTLENSGGSGGGSSYTFTNGLTESNGTVSWDLNSNILKKSNNVAIGFMNTDSISGLDGHGCVAIGRSLGGKFYTNNQGNVALGYANYGVLQPNGQGCISMGCAKENYGRLVASGSGSLAGGMADSKQMNSTNKGSFAYGLADNTYGEVYSGSEGSAALGCGVQTTTGLPGQCVVGRDNTVEADKMFIVGNGTSDSSRANLFTVDTSGNVNAAGTMTPTGADYAEYFEFEDGNINNDDRIGLLVELSGSKINLANGTDILGAISGTVGVIGDAEEMSWHGKYETDKFGRFIYEDIKVIHNEGTEEEWIETINTKKISKDYDPTMAYIPRSKRPEWAPVGLMGKVFVRQDGTLNVGDYVAAINGIATKANEKTNVRVLEVMSEGIVKILIK